MPTMYDWSVARSGAGLRVTGLLIDDRGDRHPNHRLPSVSEIECRSGRITAADREGRFYELTSVSGTLPTILEVSEPGPRRGGLPRISDLALTVRWPDGTETLELVSAQAATALGYVRTPSLGDVCDREAWKGVPRRGSFSTSAEWETAVRAYCEQQFPHRPIPPELPPMVRDVAMDLDEIEANEAGDAAQHASTVSA